MDMKPVKSDSIEAIGYDNDQKLMHIKFKSGQTYAYDGVPVDVHAALILAPSAGRHFHANIRHAFTARKVETASA